MMIEPGGERHVRTDRPERASPRVTILTCLYFVIIVGVHFAAASWRGPDVDEFWTLGFSNPAVPLADAVRLWSGDSGHPIGFEALMRLYFSVVPQSIGAARLFNLGPLLGLIAFALVRGLRARPGFDVLFAAILLATFLSLERFAQGRSYFLAYVLIAVIIMVIRDSFTGRAGPAKYAFLAFAAVLLSLVNYTAFLAGIAIFTAVAASHWIASRRTRALAMGLCLAAGMVAFGLSLANGMLYERVPEPYYVGNGAALARLALIAAMVVFAAPVAAFLALGSFSGGAVRDSRSSTTVRAMLGDFRGAMVLAAVLASAGFLAFNVLFHVLVVRQLVGLLAIMAAAIASSAVAGPAPRMGRLDRLFPAILLSGALSTVVSAAMVSREGNLMRMVPLLEAQQAACATYRVYGLSSSALYGGARTDNARQRDAAVLRGLTYIEWHSRLRIERRGQALVSDPRCGAGFWLPHAYLPASFTKRDVIDRLGLRLSARQLAAARLLAKNGSVLLEVLPSDPAGAAPSHP